jgi:outer membrane protein TolC
VEQLNVEQAQIQLLSSRKAFVSMLGLMVGENWEEAQFVKPDAEWTLAQPLIDRPELRLFAAQEELFDSRKDLLKVAYMPKIGLFLQGGYGRPGLNMLSDKFRSFYMGGVRLSWNFGALYTQKNDLSKIAVGKNTVDVQRELFLYNTALSVSRENREIERLRTLMKNDEAIIVLRENIRKATEAKVAGGMATVTDLMQDLTQENLARQAKAAREMDLLEAIYHLKNTTNN